MKKSIIIAILILILVIGWFISGQFFKKNNFEKLNIDQENNKDRSELNSDNAAINGIKVETKLSNAEKIDQSLLLQGQTIVNRSINLKSETIGNVIKKNFTRGDIVNTNDVLAEISMEDRKELLNSFNKEMKKINKEISLNKEKKDNDEKTFNQELVRINKEIILNNEKRDNDELKYKKQINLYKLEYKTAKELVDKGLGSESKLSLASFNLTQANSNLKEIEINFRSQFVNLESQLNNVESNLKEIEINFQSKSVNLESQLENIKSKIKNISIDIENTKIKAPFSGIIQNSFIEEGNYVRPGEIVASIVDLNPIKIQGYVSETDINKIKVGTNAHVEISNTLRKNGKIKFISPVAETNTRTFEFIIEANNDDLSFKSGLTTTITIDIKSVNAHKISPSILTLQDDGTVGVKALNQNNEVIFFSIEKVKDTIDGMWVTGLPDQAVIIITGQEYITEGQIVEIQ